MDRQHGIGGMNYVDVLALGLLSKLMHSITESGKERANRCKCIVIIQPWGTDKGRKPTTKWRVISHATALFFTSLCCLTSHDLFATHSSITHFEKNKLRRLC